ncbi:hypothetical protein HII31_01293 [Pseudocercospora fuligena]|uniref:Cobalamin-independent methionine synthase MetE C-terminal/archaeal domain-containing protein n=1 Tax=Pseudocercospora fuligena TaxID=685502 RepID=A0A8H6RV56_9PEZI|nr:hypothetical protein HII31_01293 [Pseudocercospora fuligena]
MTPPYRVDHVGSLLRPLELIEARAPLTRSQRGWGEPATDDELAKLPKITADSIRAVVKKQIEEGVRTISSGEYERTTFFDGMFEALSGVEQRRFSWDAYHPDLPTNRPLKKWGMTGRDSFIATGRVKREKPAYVDDWLFLRSCLPEERWKDAKMTMPPPTWEFAQLSKAYTDDSGYISDEEYLSDVASAMREEILELYDNGLRNIQIDDPNWSSFCDESWTKSLRKHGVDIRKWLELTVHAHNTLLRDLPADLNIGLHICRGNYPKGVYIVSGGYEKIAAKLFRETAYKIFYLEFDSPRAGDFGPLKHIPASRAVVLGVVSTKEAKLENFSETKERILAAARVIADARGISKDEALQEHLAISPQCGFSSDHSGGGEGVTQAIMWEKLKLLRDLAAELWPNWRSSYVDSDRS